METSWLNQFPVVIEIIIPKGIIDTNSVLTFATEVYNYISSQIVLFILSILNYHVPQM